METYFTVLPYIIVQKSFRFNGFDIWTDSVANWKKYLKTKRPASLLNIYVDKKGKKLQNKTIVTCKGAIDFEKLRTLISILFFIPSKRHFLATSAESFYYETYTNKSQRGRSASHTRVDKFVWNIVSSRGFKIYETYEASIFRLDLKQIEVSDFEKLRRLFVSKTHTNVVKSLPFYFRTQYRNLFLFPEIEDIQNFCTAFEVFFKVDVPSATGATLAEKLFSFFSLAENKERKALKDWFEELYKLRSDYTHGKDVDPKRLVYKNQRHIDIAKQVYCECVNKYLKPRRGVGRTILSSDKSLLINLFTSQDIYKDLIKMLTDGWGKSQGGEKSIDYLMKCDDKALAQLWTLFYQFVLYVNKKAISVENKKRAKAAMQTILCVLEYFVETYSKKKYKKNFYTEVLNEIKKLPLHAKTDEELDAAYQFLKNPMVKYNEVIGDLDDFKKLKFRDELKFRDLLDISMFSHVYEELYSLYKGWV
jgi:hypothetical protein